MGPEGEWAWAPKVEEGEGGWAEAGIRGAAGQTRSPRSARQTPPFACSYSSRARRLLAEWWAPSFAAVRGWRATRPRGYQRLEPREQSHKGG